jgi:oxalate decarboxylase
MPWGKFDPKRPYPCYTLTLTSITFNIDDWLAHTPKHTIARSLGVDEYVLGSLPTTNPYILNATINTHNVTGPNGELSENNSYVYFAKDHALEKVPGGGGTLRIVDTTTFPISKTIAAAIVTLKLGGLRELHWHLNVSFGFMAI